MDTRERGKNVERVKLMINQKGRKAHRDRKDKKKNDTRGK